MPGRERDRSQQRNSQQRNRTSSNSRNAQSSNIENGKLNVLSLFYDSIIMFYDIPLCFMMSLYIYDFFGLIPPLDSLHL